MAKEFRCAQCGKYLNYSHKAVPQLGKVITVIAPHECGDVIDFTLPDVRTQEEKIQEGKQLELLDFSKKLTEVGKSALRNVTITDQRPRREVRTSSAPDNILRAFAKDDFTDGGEMEG